MQLQDEALGPIHSGGVPERTGPWSRSGSNGTTGSQDRYAGYQHVPEEAGPTVRIRREHSSVDGVFEGPRANISESATPWAVFTATAKWYAEAVMKKVLLGLAIIICLVTAGRII